MAHEEIKQYIKSIGYMVLSCINSQQVLVVKRSGRGNGCHNFGYHFDSIEEAYEYFTSK